MSRYTFSRELSDGHLNDGDCIVFGDDVYTVCKDLRGYYLNNAMVNSAIFTELGIENIYDFCGVSENAGAFPYHGNLGALTRTVKKLLLKYQKKRLNEFDWVSFHKRGDLVYLRKETIKLMCRNQVNQGNLFDPEVFANCSRAGALRGGFDWNTSPEGYMYWDTLLNIASKKMVEYKISCDCESSSEQDKEQFPEIVILNKYKQKTLLTL